MNITKLANHYEDDKILFSYNGVISQIFVKGIKNLINGTLITHNNNIEATILRKLFEISVEQLQNIMSYSKNNIQKDQTTYESEGLCILGYCTQNDKYFITTLNHIEKEDKDKLEQKLTKVNDMDSKEQRKYLRELLRSGVDSHSRGAGVGFLEIARRSSEKLKYSFEETIDGLFFELTIYI